MENLPSELKIELMKHCDINTLINLSFTCKDYQKKLYKIKPYISGLKHPDSYRQLCVLIELLHTLEQKPYELVEYYSILIKQLQDYINYSNCSVRNLYANLLIGIMAAKLNDKVNLLKVCNSLYEECIEQADSELLLQYLLEKIKSHRKDKTNFATIETQILAAIDNIKGPYDENENCIKKNAWLFKLSLLNFNQIKAKQVFLLKEIVKWFTAQVASTFGNFAVIDDVYLNIRWLAQNMSSADIQQYVSKDLLASLLPLSKYNYFRKKRLCLTSEEALHILSLVGVDYFNKLITEQKFTISNRNDFLLLLARTQSYSVLNLIISTNRNYWFGQSKNAWAKLYYQFTTSKEIIAKLDDTTRQVILYPNINELLTDLEQTKDINKFRDLTNFLSKKLVDCFNEALLKRIYDLALIFINSPSSSSFEPWLLKKVLKPEQYAVVESQYVTKKLLGNDFYSLFRIISSTENKDFHQLVIEQLEVKLKSKCLNLYNLNDIVTRFENLLTANMQDTIIKQYELCLANDIEADVYHDACRTGLKILKRWRHLEKFEKQVKNLIIQQFNAIDFADTSAYQFGINCGKANNFIRFYVELFDEDEKILNDKFYTKLKPTLEKLLLDDYKYSCHNRTRNELFDNLFKIGESVAKDIIQNLWLSIINSNQMLEAKKIEKFAEIIQFCSKNIPQQITATEIVPKLILHVNNKTVAYCLMKIYNSLTDEQRKQLTEIDSPLKNVFIQFYQLCVQINDGLAKNLIMK